MTSNHEYHQYGLENGGMDDRDDMTGGFRSGEGEVGPDDPERKPSPFETCEVCGRGLTAEDLELNSGMCWKCHHE